MKFSSTPQFHSDPFSSTHRFHTRTTPFHHPNSLSSTPETSQFNTKNPSVPHPKPLITTRPSVPNQNTLSSTPKTPQFNTSLSYFLSEGFMVWNWGGFWCKTEGLWGLKRSERFVWNWCVELRGTRIYYRDSFCKIEYISYKTLLNND